VQVNLAAGPAIHPRTGQPQRPRYLGGVEPEFAPGTDRREAYARWLTAPENPFFARGLVNRLWSYFFHRGIIEPVDDVRNTNPPINPALLDALTKDFIASRFDMRHLMRRIVTSATYQRTSLATPSNRHDDQNFSHAIPRRIPAEALLDSLVQATGVPEAFGGAPGGFRAAQLPDASIDSSSRKRVNSPRPHPASSTLEPIETFPMRNNRRKRLREIPGSVRPRLSAGRKGSSQSMRHLLHRPGPQRSG
jgi:hypothetical protein